jgi:hypothetical protein
MRQLDLIILECAAADLAFTRLKFRLQNQGIRAISRGFGGSCIRHERGRAREIGPIKARAWSVID